MTTIAGTGDARIKARPTTYAGIRMRSRLEASYAQNLDRLGVCWEYEPQCFAGPAGQWLPDFKETWPSMPGVTCYTEVKPANLYDERTHDDAWAALSAIMRRMEVVWDSEQRAQLTLMLWDYEHGAITNFHAADADCWEVVYHRGGNRLGVPVKLEDA